MSLNNQKLTDRSIQVALDAALENVQPEGWVTRIADFVTSAQTKGETWIIPSDTSLMREWKGERVYNDLSHTEFSVKVKQYENTLLVDRRDIELNNGGIVDRAIANIAAESQRHYARMLHDVMTDGTALAHDGIAFYGNRAGKFDNDLAATDLDITALTSGDRLAVAEGKDLLLGVEETFLSMKDANGEPANADLDLLIFCSPKQRRALRGSMEAQMIVEAGAAVSNLVSIVSGTSMEIVSNARFDDDTIYVVNVANKKPFIILEEGQPRYEVQGEGSAVAFEKKKHAFGIEHRRGFAGYLPQGVLKIDLTA